MPMTHIGAVRVRIAQGRIFVCRNVGHDLWNDALTRPNVDLALRDDLEKPRLLRLVPLDDRHPVP